jgi:hypothetical protein
LYGFRYGFGLGNFEDAFFDLSSKTVLASDFSFALCEALFYFALVFCVLSELAPQRPSPTDITALSIEAVARISACGLPSSAPIGIHGRNIQRFYTDCMH